MRKLYFISKLCNIKVFSLLKMTFKLYNPKIFFYKWERLWKFSQ